MAERIYPAAKPNPPAPSQPQPVLNGNANGNGHHAANGNGVQQIFPPPKSQQYGANRPTYRPLPRRQRRRRNYCCACFLWTTFILIGILLLAAIAGAVIYSIYQPKKPSFALNSLKISQFNITDSKSDDTAHLNSKLNLTILAKSENKDMIYYFNPVNVSVTPQNHPDFEIGAGSVPDFVLGTHNSTLLRFGLSDSDILIQDLITASSLKSDLKMKSGWKLKVRLNTKVKVKMGVFNTRKVGLEVICDQIKLISAVEKVKGAKNVTTSVTTWKLDDNTAKSKNSVKCKFNLRIKIWKWTF
ncbi:hypothetical protein MKW94_005668 [Papaver nudicaule]|uniref:Late embryogenesis abundant protein LEA-2 subgroup domain-containing protein n=1 Tax=Papaver nudicaule TaxID=74823 RepID=A0AA41VIN4_PAPNU|nr:hypothetical protein [Papaver nudicaule]